LGVLDTTRALNPSKGAPPSGYQVEDQNNNRYNDQQMNQAATDMEAEAEQPQNQENYENCPKHILLLQLLAPAIHGDL
jgi:hypothetical protein